MSASATVRDERLDLRMPGSDKDLLERAAAYRHVPLSSFVLTVALAEARQVITQAESVRLSAADTGRLMAYLDQTPAPTPTLVESVSFTTIVERCGLTTPEVSSILTRLDLKGLVRAEAGGLYVRIGNTPA